MNKISARIIADSLNRHGQRITTFVLVFPRIVLAEFNTHRMLSRNSASSRAIPFKKMVKMAIEDPFIPIKWMKEHTGMQGNSFFNGEFGMGFPNDNTTDIEFLEREWLKARDNAVCQAELLSLSGLTKQLCNRLLEPFMWHTVICTGTEWENFFALRSNPQAEIHIQALADEMLKVYNENTPKQLNDGEWHIPFGDNISNIRVMKIATGEIDLNNPFHEKMIQIPVKIATARCARVSYLNFEGKDDYEADIRLHDQLLASGHMSPFEHCAKAMNDDELEIFTTCNAEGTQYGWSGNFRGFIQYRKMLSGENKQDSRVIKK